MTFVRKKFLNWTPDLESYETEGLQTADNVIHDADGYKEFTYDGTFNTNTALGTCTSAIVRSVGTNNQRVVAYLNNATAAGAGYTIDLSIGMLSAGYTTIGNYTTVTSGTISSNGTLNRVVAFDVCELADKLFFVARAEMQTNTALSGSTNVAVMNLVGHADI